MNKYKLPILLLACLFVVSCGGSSDFDYRIFNGTWIGKVEQASDCVTIGPDSSDVIELEYRLEVQTGDVSEFGYREVFIKDSFGNTYSGVITDNEVTAHNDSESEETDELVTTGPSNITLIEPENSKVKVQFVYFGGRYCADVYLGEFAKEI